MDSRWTASPGLALLGAATPTCVTEWSQAAERAGVGSLWIVEDYFHPGAFALAAAAAAVTERVLIGLGVVNPYTRHPALLAMEAAALAGLAPDRVVLGLGSSNRRWIEEQMGIAFKTPLEAVRECVAILRPLLRGERVSHHGHCFSVERVKLEFAPPAAPPIFLGFKGPKGLRLAGEIADGVHCAVLSSPAHVRRVRQTTAAARGGRPGDFTVIAYVPMAVSDDGRRAREWVKPLLARYLGVLHGQSILEDAGLPAARTQPFREALAAGRDARALVSDELVDTVAVAGTPEHCRRQLGRWAEAGLDAPVAVVPREADMREQIAHIGALAWR